MLLGKQARRIITLDESSPVVSCSSGDERDKAYIEKRFEGFKKMEFKSELDRRLILGLIDRNVELNQEKRAETVGWTGINNDEYSSIEPD